MGSVARKCERTCIGCGKRSDKVDLHRIVRTADGTVRFDATGRLPGRGAYVCSRACLEAASAKGKLQRSLRCSTGVDTARQVADELEKALEGACAR